MARAKLDLPLRAKKAARIKFAVLDAATELLGTGSLESLTVDDICQGAEISRVTFFKYFPTKDAIMLYFAWRWWLDATVESLSDPLHGLDAIDRIFDRVADAYVLRPGFFLGFLGFLCRRRGIRDGLEGQRPTTAEKALLHPQLDDPASLEIVPLNEMCRIHIREAIASGDLPDVDVGEVASQLGAVMYGTPLMATMREGVDLGREYRAHVHRLLRCQRQ